jgi:hypothetical protein
MALANIQAHPSLSNQETRKHHIGNALCTLDNHIDLLRLAADSADANDADQTLIDSLYFLHARLRQQTDALMVLL